MILLIETKQATEAIKAMVRECQDVLNVSDADADSSLEGRGYEGVVSAMDDAVRIGNNLLRRIGEEPVLPAKPEPEPELEGDTDPLTTLEAQKASLDEKLAAVAGEATEADPEPPEAIADLFDSNLTPKENHDALIAKFAVLKSEEERYRSYGDNESMTKAMELLERAERIDSGIQWNRAVNAEVLG